MTDYQKLIDMFKRADVTYCEVEVSGGKYVSVASCTGKNEGMSGLSTSFRFDYAGTLISVGVWEHDDGVNVA